MTEEARNEAVVRRWFQEVWNEGKDAVIDELFAADGVAHGIGEADRDLKGPPAFKAFYYRFRAAFPDPNFTIHDVVAQGNRVAARWTLKLTHGGEHLGIAATGRQVEVTGMSFLHFRDGLVTDAWNNWDMLTLTQEITAVKPPVTFIEV